jgi:hypothetical protein
MFQDSDRELLQHIHELLHQLKQPSSEPAVLALALRLGALEGKVNAMHEEFKAGFERLEKATTAVGERLDELAKELEGGVTAEEAVPLMAQLTSLGDKLEAMGKKPADPDPVPLPPPV